MGNTSENENHRQKSLFMLVHQTTIIGKICKLFFVFLFLLNFEYGRCIIYMEIVNSGYFKAKNDEFCNEKGISG